MSFEKMRAAHCMVKLNNMTQSVDNNLCEDARLPTPVTIQKCETDDCPQWTVTDWKPCEESKCFTWNTGKTISGSVVAAAPRVTGPLRQWPPNRAQDEIVEISLAFF